MSIQLCKWSHIVLSAFSCLLLVFIPIPSNTQNGAAFFDNHDITHETNVLDWSEFLAEQQFLSVYQQSCIASLIGDYGVLDLDVSAEQVLLYLSDNDQSFLRLALWDTILEQYSTKDTGLLPADSYLDTYHDGDSILFMMPLGENMITESAPNCNELYLT